MPDDIRSTIFSGNHLRVFSVYISLLISRVRPVHSFFEKKSILENTSQITKNTSNKRDHPDKGWSLLIYEKKVLLAEFSSKEFSVQTSDMLH